MKMIQYSFLPSFSAIQMRLWGFLGWVLFSCVLSGFHVGAVWATPKVTIIPFTSTQSGSQSSFEQVSSKLAKKLRNKQVKVVAADSKGRQSQEFKLPHKATYQRAVQQYRAGKALLRNKKPDKAREKLESALKNFEKSLIHVQDWNDILDLYRLLGLCYFRMGMEDEGEEVIQRLGRLVPHYKFSVSKMPPAMRRVLKRAQQKAMKAKNTLVIGVPSGSSLQFNKMKTEATSNRVVINKLATGKHYLWVRKAGFLPYGQVIQVKAGTKALSIALKPIPKASGPNLSGQLATVRSLLSRRQLTSKVGRVSKEIASALHVDAVMMGYFHKVSGQNKLHMFVYQASEDKLRRFPVFTFDEELLEVDIKMISIGSKVKASLSALTSLPVQPWMQPQAVAVAPTARTPQPPVRVAVQPRPRPAARSTAQSDDDDDDDLDAPTGGPQIARQPPPRRVEPRPVVRPVVRRVEPRPVPRRPEPRTTQQDDDDDLDDNRVVRRVPPRPAPRPVVRVEPKPRKRVVLPSILNRVPSSLKRDRAALKRDKRNGRRIARLSRRSKTTKSFDPDRDIDWSNPIPKVSSHRASLYVPSQPPVRRAPQRDDDDDDDQLAPAVRKPVRPVVRERQPAPRPVVRTPQTTGDVGWSSNPTIPSPRKRPTPKAATKGIASAWWFWTLLGTGAVAVGTTIGLVYIHTQPATAFNVLVNPNPPQ